MTRDRERDRERTEAVHHGHDFRPDVHGLVVDAEYRVNAFLHLRQPETNISQKITTTNRQITADRVVDAIASEDVAIGQEPLRQLVGAHKDA